MTPPPIEVIRWLKRTYPRPSVDPEWLQGCWSWIEEELHLDPARDMPKILENVNTQLLGSDLSDSMLPGTGFPENILGANHVTFEGPILVEVVGMMEIGHSAYTLLQIYESREEYRKQAALREARGGQRDGEERKPMPKYPRSMLQFQLSDGTAILPAIECKPFPDIELGETPLGYKMIIRNVTVRNGTALLQPNSVELLGHQTEDRDAQRDFTFFRALKARLGEDVPEPPPPPEAEPAPAPAPAQNPPAAPRAALRDISPPAADEAGPSGSPRRVEHEHDDDMGQPRRRKRPSRAGRSPSPDPPPRDVVLQRSRYFSKPPSGARTSEMADANADANEDVGRVRVNSGDASAMRSLARAIGLSPPRAPPMDLPSSDDDENPFLSGANGNGNGKGKGKQREPSFGEPGSEDYEFDFDMDDSFLEQVDRAAQEALLRDAAAAAASNAANDITTTTTSVAAAAAAAASTATGRAHSVQAPQTQTRVKPEPRSQSTTRTLFATAASATAVGTQRRAGSAAARPASSSSSAAAMEVIDISDDEVEGDKENVPVPTRHVRRRVATQPPEEDVIELSD